jgi:transcriptional regulator with XRE-family HTH domain
MAMGQPREDLDRLASYVVAARIAAGFPARKDFAAATGVTARTLGKLETGSERVSAETLARVAEALAWTPDSPALVMAGREPVPAAGRPRPLERVPPAGGAAAAATGALAAVLADMVDQYGSGTDIDSQWVRRFRDTPGISDAERIRRIREYMIAVRGEVPGEAERNGTAG